MKCKPLQRFLITAKSFILTLVILCGHGDCLFAGDNPNSTKKLDDIIIELKVESSSLQEILLTIEAQTAFHFVYNEKTLQKHKQVKVSPGSESLGNVLRNISKQTQLAFKRLDDNIHISDWKKDEQAVQEVLMRQSRTITGTVVSQADGETLPGVTVLVKGTNNGTITDIDGKYSIEANDGDVLVFSSIGYLSQEVVVGGQSVINVTLAEDVQSLEEVVVIGYGTVRREELTSSVVSINQKDFISGAVSRMVSPAVSCHFFIISSRASVFSAKVPSSARLSVSRGSFERLNNCVMSISG